MEQWQEPILEDFKNKIVKRFEFVHMSTESSVVIYEVLTEIYKTHSREDGETWNFKVRTYLSLLLHQFIKIGIPDDRSEVEK